MLSNLLKQSPVSPPEETSGIMDLKIPTDRDDNPPTNGSENVADDSTSRGSVNYLVETERATAGSIPRVEEEKCDKSEQSSSSSSGRSLGLGSLSIHEVYCTESARKFRARHLGDKPLSLAIFPGSCCPPTKQHMEIVDVVRRLSFVDQVWVDLNYESFTKKSLEETYLHRLLMVQKEVCKIPKADTCVLSKNMRVASAGDTKEMGLQKTRNYWNVCRIICGEGKLSWVIGGDVLSSMIWWKENGLIGLEAIDKLIVFSRTIPKDDLYETMIKIFGDEEKAADYWNKKTHFIPTGDISSTMAREALSTLLSCISLDTLAYLATNPSLLESMIGWEPDKIHKQPLKTPRAKEVARLLEKKASDQ